MPADRTPTPEPDPDVADVVTGPVGSAHLKDPTTSRATSGDVYELPGADPPTDVPAGDPSPRSEGQSQEPPDRPANAEGR